MLLWGAVRKYVPTAARGDVLREMENILNMAGTEMAQRCRRDREGAYEMLSRMSLTGGGGGVEKRRKSKTTVAPVPSLPPLQQSLSLSPSLPLSLPLSLSLQQSLSLSQSPSLPPSTKQGPWQSTAAATATGCALGFAP